MGLHAQIGYGRYETAVTAKMAGSLPRGHGLICYLLTDAPVRRSAASTVILQWPCFIPGHGSVECRVHPESDLLPEVDCRPGVDSRSHVSHPLVQNLREDPCRVTSHSVNHGNEAPISRVI
jgi:hypothetical protein